MKYACTYRFGPKKRCVTTSARPLVDRQALISNVHSTTCVKKVLDTFSLFEPWVSLNFEN